MLQLYFSILKDSGSLLWPQSLHKLECLPQGGPHGWGEWQAWRNGMKTDGMCTLIEQEGTLHSELRPKGRGDPWNR